MKNLIVLMILAILVVPAAAWAGEGRAFSPDQEKKIRMAIHDAYPNGVKIDIRDIGWGQTRIVCWAKYLDDYLLFTASENGNIRLNEIFPGNARRTGEKLEKKIEVILNPSAGEELGRDYLERRGIGQ